MAIVSKTFLHNDDKILGASGSADGILPEDVQDWITANGGTIDGTSNLNISMCPVGTKVLTLIVIDDNS